MDLDEQYDEDDEDAPIRSRRRKTKSSGLVKSACVSRSSVSLSLSQVEQPADAALLAARSEFIEESDDDE